MWNPGFPFEERSRALLIGRHRRLCVVSRHHRGTAARPGLVMGLDRGGSCRGIAYRVPAAAVAATLAYLDEREIAHYKSEEHTSEIPSLMRITYAVFCLKKKKTQNTQL